MGHRDLLAERVVPVGAATGALTAPYADERQQGQQRVVEADALSQVRRVGGNGKIVERGKVPGGRDLGSLEGAGDGTVARPGGDHHSR